MESNKNTFDSPFCNVKKNNFKRKEKKHNSRSTGRARAISCLRIRIEIAATGVPLSCPLAFLRHTTLLPVGLYRYKKTT